ncbi:MAG TPA: hypothetical protein EYP04_05235, partial [Anaerolineae bacterium]|nr:hypothetical protein [Anaerolineae bacterium]
MIVTVASAPALRRFAARHRPVLASDRRRRTGIVQGARKSTGIILFGNLVLIRDPKGRETALTHDEHGRRLTRTLPLGQT